MLLYGKKLGAHPGFLARKPQDFLSNKDALFQWESYPWGPLNRMEALCFHFKMWPPLLPQPPCLVLTAILSCHDVIDSHPSRTVGPNKLFLLWVALVMVFCRCNKNQDDSLSKSSLGLWKFQWPSSDFSSSPASLPSAVVCGMRCWLQTVV